MLRARLWTAKTALAVLLAALVALEMYLVFVDQTGWFRIHGKERIEISLGADSIAHAFLMDGDGLTAVHVKIVGRSRDAVALGWTLWRGFRDEPDTMTVAATGTKPITLTPGPQWVSFEVTRDGSSHNRWYTIEFKREAPAGVDLSTLPYVGAIASADNPDRGGVLWVGQQRKPGSLYLDAETRGRTIYRRFQLNVEPKLPAALRNHVLQWLIVAAIHWGFAVWVLAMLDETRAAPLR